MEIVKMNKVLASALLLLVFLGCGGGNSSYSSKNNPSFKESVKTLPKKEVITDKWQPLIEGAEIAQNLSYPYTPSEMKLSNEMLLRGKDWDEYLKPFILTQPKENWEVILQGLTRFHTSYDKVDKVMRFEPLRYISGPYSGKTNISVRGLVDKKKASASLRFYYYSKSWLFVNRITVVADDYTWKSPSMNFKRDHSHGNIWEYEYLNLSDPRYRELANKISQSKEVIIRFHGRQYYDDFTVPDRMKNDLRYILRAIDAING